MEIAIVRDILNANDQVAAENRSLLKTRGVTAVNMMASPGAGKTSVIAATAERLPPDLRPGVIEGDLASSIDTDALLARGIPAVQINTGGNCHLDAPMIRSALPRLPLDEIGVLFIENVGNLVCPAEFDLGRGAGSGDRQRAGRPRQTLQVSGHVRRGRCRTAEQGRPAGVLRLRPGLLPPRAGDGQPGCAAAPGFVSDE